MSAVLDRSIFRGWGGVPPPAPRKVWTRDPVRPGIAAALLASPDLLRLGDRRLVLDIRARFSVGVMTAYRAVRDARRAAP